MNDDLILKIALILGLCFYFYLLYNLSKDKKNNTLPDWPLPYPPIPPKINIGKYLNESDLVSFGEYLLSEKRINSIEKKENLNKVHQEDIDNWKQLDYDWHTDLWIKRITN